MRNIMKWAILVSALTWGACTSEVEGEIGSIEVGKLADFTILNVNPLTTPAEDWPHIKIWGVVLGGEKKHHNPHNNPQAIQEK